MRKTGMKGMFGLFHRPERSFHIFQIDYPKTHNNFIIILKRCQAIFETNSDSSHVRTSFLNSFRFLFNQIARKFPKINIFLFLGNFMPSDGGDGRVLHALICMRYEKRSRRLLFSYRWRWRDNSATLRDSLRLPPGNELPRRSPANANPCRSAAALTFILWGNSLRS